MHERIRTTEHITSQHNTAQHNKATQTNTCRNHKKKTAKTKKIEHITTQYKTPQRITRPQNDTKKHRTVEQKNNASHHIASHTTTHTTTQKHIVVTTRGHQVFVPNKKKHKSFASFLLTPGAQAVVQSKNKNSRNRSTEPISLVCRINQKKKQVRIGNTAPMRMEHSKRVDFQYDNYFYFLLALIIY